MLYLLLVLLAVILTLANNYNFSIFVIPSNPDFHFGLITVSSIFAGFLYTNYSMLLEFAESEIGQKIAATQIIAKRSKHIVTGIVCALISIISGLLLTIKVESKFINILSAFSWVIYAIYCIEIIFVFTTIFWFSKSLFEMHILLKSRSCTGTQKVDSETMQKIKQQLEKGK